MEFLQLGTGEYKWLVVHFFNQRLAGNYLSAGRFRHLPSFPKKRREIIANFKFSAWHCAIPPAAITFLLATGSHISAGRSGINAVIQNWSWAIDLELNLWARTEVSVQHLYEHVVS